MQVFWSTPELNKSIWRHHMKNQWTAFGIIKGCHVAEDYCQIKVFSSLDWRNTNACLAGVLIWNKKDFRSKNFVFLQKDADLAQSMTFFINEYLWYVNSKYYFCQWFNSDFEIMFSFWLLSYIDI